jgi:hypothetical protein
VVRTTFVADVLARYLRHAWQCDGPHRLIDVHRNNTPTTAHLTRLRVGGEEAGCERGDEEGLGVVPAEAVVVDEGFAAGGGREEGLEGGDTIDGLAGAVSVAAASFGDGVGEVGFTAGCGSTATESPSTWAGRDDIGMLQQIGFLN